MAADTHSEGAGEGAGDKISDDEASIDTGSNDTAASDTASTALSETAPVGLGAGFAAAADRVTQDVPEGGPRTLGSRLLDYSAHAAMIVGLLGFAWTVSNHIVARPAPAHGGTGPVAATAKLEIAKPDPAVVEIASLRQTNQRLAEDVRNLRANLDALSAKVRDDRTPAQVKILQAGLENVQNGLAAVRSETGSAVAQLGGRLDKFARDRAEHDAAARSQSGEHAGKPEKNSADLTTGSLPPTAKATAPAAKPQALVAEEVPLPPSKPGKSDADAPAKAVVIAGYVVRDVSGGVAVIEGRGGVMEVVPGVSIPGAGVVKSIERRGKGWAVITSKGQLAYAPLASDYRHTSQRDYYPAYHDDF